MAIATVMIIADDNCVCHSSLVRQGRRRRGRYVTGQTSNDPRLKIEHKGIAEALVHERNALIVGREVRGEPSCGMDLGVSRRLEYGIAAWIA